VRRLHVRAALLASSAFIAAPAAAQNSLAHPTLELEFGQFYHAPAQSRRRRA
jgi:hypothetical protein